MKTRLFAAAAVVMLASPAAHAWEPETTQEGLAEQAALSSALHKRLEQIGFTGGLYEQLTIPPADAPALIDALKLLSPSQGAVPDARGRQAAMSWLAAGAALADLPSAQAANHFYDPKTGTGWHKPGRDILDSLSDAVRARVGRASIPDKGMPAPDWVVAKDNPFSLSQFLEKYTKAVTAPTAGERGRHMAAALISAGAIIHALGDLGSPARVRGDYAAQLDPLGGGPDDLGSRFERIAALAYGRLGVPAPARVITRAHLRDYFTAKDGSGLAELIGNTYFSPNTLPSSYRVIGDAPKLSRPLPALPGKLNLMAAGRDDATIRTPAGVCLARYRVEHDVLTFSLDDDCMLEEVTAILPEVAAYETGLLDFLFRGELTFVPSPSGKELAITAKGLGAGQIDVLVEDDRGVRTSLASTQTGGGAELVRVPVPLAGIKVVAVYRGVDASSEPIVAVGSMALAQPQR